MQIKGHSPHKSPMFDVWLILTGTSCLSNREEKALVSPLEAA